MEDLTSFGRFTITDRLKSSIEFDTFIAHDDKIKVFIKKAKSIKSNDLILTEINIYKKIPKSHFFVNLIDFSTEGDLFWIALEYEEGYDLKNYIEKYGPIEELDWFELASNLHLALFNLHKANIIHRDIKPSNILISDNGPKLIDFAYSIDQTEFNAKKNIDSYEENIFDSIDDEFLGTPAFSSPEHYSGEIAEEMDVFSLASTLAFASQGKSPFEKSSDTETANAVKLDSPNLKGLSPMQARFLNPSFVKNKSQRIKLKNQTAGVQSHIKFIIDKKQTRDFLDWPQFTDLSYSSASSQTTLGTASKLRVLGRQYFELGLSALKIKKYYFFGLLIFLTILAALRYIDYVKTQQNIRESEIAISCLKNTRDEFLKTNFYITSEKEYLNSSDFNLETISRLCKDALSIENPLFQNSLAYYYGILGDKQRQHDILLANAQKNQIFINALIQFYIYEDNIRLYGQNWLDNCPKSDLFCADIYSRFLQESGDSSAALDYINSYSDLSPKFEVWKAGIQSNLGITNINYESIAQTARDNDLAAQMLMYKHESSNGRFDQADYWARKMSKQHSMGYIFLALSEIRNEKSNYIKILKKCIDKFPLEPYCYELKALALTLQDQSQDVYDLPPEKIQEIKDTAETGLLLGADFLELEDIEIFTELPQSEDSIKYQNLVISQWNRHLDINYRAASRNNESAFFNIAYIRYTLLGDLETSCKFYRKGVEKMRRLELQPLQRVNVDVYSSSNLKFNSAKFYKKLFEDSLKTNFESCDLKG